MAKQQDFSKMKKDDLAAYLARKLSKPDLVWIAEQVHGGRLADGAEAAFAPTAGTVVPDDQGVTPEDTTAAAEQDTHDWSHPQG